MLQHQVSNDIGEEWRERCDAVTEQSPGLIHRLDRIGLDLLKLLRPELWEAKKDAVPVTGEIALMLPRLFREAILRIEGGVEHLVPCHVVAKRHEPELGLTKGKRYPVVLPDFTYDVGMVPIIDDNGAEHPFPATWLEIADDE